MQCQSCGKEMASDGEYCWDCDPTGEKHQALMPGDDPTLVVPHPPSQHASAIYSPGSERVRSNGDLYLLAYGSDKPENLHWNTKPELLAKGDWNTDPSFDIPTETTAGTPSHTFVTVSPDPVVVKLSTGAPVKCWNKTITVTAGDNFDQTTNELYCPAIGQKISSTDTVIFPDKRTRTTTITLTHFSL